MKKSHEVPPLRVGAHLHPDGTGQPRLKWSRIEAFEETVDIGFPSSKASDLMLRVKRWIDRWIGAYEDETRMLRRLHRTEHLEIVVTNENETPEQLAPLVANYWQERQTRHNRRMLIAGMAVLPALLLTVIPGPNIVGIPLAYLAWHHWRIVRGLKRVRSGDIQVELKSPARVIPRHGEPTAASVFETNDGQEFHEAADVQHS